MGDEPFDIGSRQVAGGGGGRRGDHVSPNVHVGPNRVTLVVIGLGGAALVLALPLEGHDPLAVPPVVHIGPRGHRDAEGGTGKIGQPGQIRVDVVHVLDDVVGTDGVDLETQPGGFGDQVVEIAGDVVVGLETQLLGDDLGVVARRIEDVVVDHGSDAELAGQQRQGAETAADLDECDLIERFVDAPQRPLQDVAEELKYPDGRLLNVAQNPAVQLADGERIGVERRKLGIETGCRLPDVRHKTRTDRPVGEVVEKSHPGRLYGDTDALVARTAPVTGQIRSGAGLEDHENQHHEKEHRNSSAADVHSFLAGVVAGGDRSFARQDHGVE